MSQFLKIAQIIKQQLEQGGHVQFKKNGDYGYITESGVRLIERVLIEYTVSIKHGFLDIKKEGE